MKTIAIVGRPNVGKSSLYNRLTKTRDAIVADMPGLTRDRHYGKISIGNHEYILVDTGGFEPDKKAGIQKEMALQTKLAIDESDVILFIVDARSGLHSIDQHIAEIIRKNNNQKMLLVNKAEGMLDDNAFSEFYKLGFKNIHKISSAHGDGISGLRDFLADQGGGENTLEEEDDNFPKISIVGRPNVGKSTLINSLLGEDRFIAFDKPGTTRDAVSVDFIWGKEKFILTDTAGIRKKGKVFESVEKFSVIKTLNAIEFANVAMLVIDAKDGISAQDMHILGFILESGKSLVIALNKWDSVSEYEREKLKSDIDKKLPFVRFAEKVFISALNQDGFPLLMKSVIKAYKAAQTKFTTPQLNSVLSNALLSHAPSIVRGIRPKLKYAHQGGMNPPTIIIHGNHLEGVKQDYIRFLESYYRKAFNLTGTPLRIQLKNSVNPFEEKIKSGNKKTGLVSRRRVETAFREKMKRKNQFN
ncbi:ribosome biogenesis GTPase Der [Methylophilaceae bacterium]|nr:ribosome biogenesis GTPase Der [Methylophilaceae bacterium]|tara:strand:+ start:115 stop:1530 length:1416 start_codon:yes stop_codon:yes gene_type:complete